MYCIKCGVKLADSETCCPLCSTKVYHPDIEIKKEEGLFPENKYPSDKKNFKWPQVLLTAAFLLPAAIVLLCDLNFGGDVTWSGYVIGALCVIYICTVLPSWFKDANPVIFVPCGFAAIGLFLLYIDLVTKGNWFMTLAFPIVGGVAAIVTAVVTLLRYVKRGKLYIFGGATLAMGGLALLIEFLVNITFGFSGFIGWSLYPLVTLCVIGGLLIFFAICRPAREDMERRFFI